MTNIDISSATALVWKEHPSLQKSVARMMNKRTKKKARRMKKAHR